MGYRKFFLFQVRHMLRSRDWSAVPAAASNILQILPAIASRASLFWRERGRYSAESSAGLGSGLTLPALTRSPPPGAGRSEERRGGKECVSTFRSRWSQNH